MTGTRIPDGNGSDQDDDLAPGTGVTYPPWMFDRVEELEGRLRHVYKRLDRIELDGSNLPNGTSGSRYDDGDFCPAREIRRRCGGISVKTLQRLRKDHGFPAPDKMIAGRPWWTWGRIRHWFASDETIDHPSEPDGNGLSSGSARPLPRDDDLIRSNDVRRRLGGISEMTLWRWEKHQGFPRPAMRISGVKYWYWDDIQCWADARNGKA